VSNRRLTGRDYKGVRRGGLDLGRWRDLGIGFGVGLVIALVIYVSDHRQAQNAGDGSGDGSATAAPAAHRTSGHAPNGRSETSADGPDAAADRYDFYDGLPKFEMVVPEKEHGTRVDAAARIERPGTYFLQAGSYRNAEDANRIQAQLARENITANVQRVALDADVWYRIRIGPIKDLDQLNRLRQQLQAAEIVSLVIRVEE
jgi:cell division protein FtsN